MASQTRWDSAYEWKAVTLLAFGFGLVGLDRWIIAPLFPFMAKDLGRVVAIPGFLVGVGLWLVLREPGASCDVRQADVITPHSEAGYLPVFRSRNVLLCMLALACAMSCIFVLGGMLPNYLIDYLHLTPQQMGFVASALGFGGFVGQFAVPGVSDLLGRRLTAVLTFAAAAFGVWGVMHTGASPAALFMMVFVVSLFSLGAVALITGPMATESAPVGLVSSAIGVVVGSGEIIRRRDRAGHRRRHRAAVRDREYLLDAAGRRRARHHRFGWPR